MAIVFSDQTQSYAAHVVNVSYFSDTGRRSCPTTTGTADQNKVLWDWTVDKKVSNSYLCAFGYLNGKNNNSGELRQSYQIGGSYSMGGWTWQYSSAAHFKTISIGIPLTQYTGTGNTSMGIGFNVGNTQTGQSPFSIINPNNSDNARYSGGTRSYVTVLEVVLP